VILLIDGMNLFIRSFVVNPSMSSHGHHVGGIIGFINSTRKLIEDYRPEKVIIVWEGGGSTKRRKLYPEYKKKSRPQKLNRFYEDDIPNSVENRNYQVVSIINLLRCTKIRQVYIDDCEADDVIGYLAMYRFANDRKLIASSDKDFYQLLNNKTIIYSPTKKDIVTSRDVLEKYGISANNFCLAKCLCGDASDNIVGVKGAGFKTIAKRFPVFALDESLLIDDIISLSRQMNDTKRSPKVFKTIIDSEDIIRMNWKLAFLDTSTLAHFQIEKINKEIDTLAVMGNKIEMLKKLIKEGIKTVDVDRLFLSLSCIRDK